MNSLQNKVFIAKQEFKMVIEEYSNPLKDRLTLSMFSPPIVQEQINLQNMLLASEG